MVLLKIWARFVQPFLRLLETNKETDKPNTLCRIPVSPYAVCTRDNRTVTWSKHEPPPLLQTGRSCTLHTPGSSWTQRTP